jgi:hypothetical protein
MSIVRGRRVYVEIKSIGECNDKGKSVLSFGFKGKVIAEPDRTLAMLVIPFIGEMLRLARYSDGEAAKADMGALRSYLDGLEIREPEPKEAS